MVAALTLFLFIAFLFVFFKFTQLNDRVQSLEKQMNALKNEISRLRYRKTDVAASAQDMPAPASADQPSTVSPDQEHITPAAPVAQQSIPARERTDSIYKPVEIPPAGEIPPAIPVPPPPIIEQPSMPSVRLDESPSAFSAQQSETSASGASAEQKEKEKIQNPKRLLNLRGFRPGRKMGGFQKECRLGAVYRR